MADSIEVWGKGSLVQHGQMNNRVYLMKLHKEDFPGIIEGVSRLAVEHGYTKIFCKVPGWAAPRFISDGFITEAYIPGFYNQKETAFFVSKFLSSDRQLGIEHEDLLNLSQLLKGKENGRDKRSLGKAYLIKELGPGYAEEISSLYRQVFETYPFAIDQPEYIRETMQDRITYFGVEYKGKLVALSSAEVDREASNAEMTDFATLPACRGNNFSLFLLSAMEEIMASRGIKTFYTIARLASGPMNRSFLKMGYTYGGTLIKNTNISGSIESMNVWYKSSGKVKYARTENHLIKGL